MPWLIDILHRLTHRQPCREVACGSATNSVCARHSHVDPLWHRTPVVPHHPAMTQRKQAGFTLLEILVALVVLGFLVAGLAQGLRLGVSTWQAQARTQAARGDLDAADRTLRTLIARMDPGGVSGRPAIFKGTSHSLLFTTTLPQAADGLVSRGADVTLAVDDGHQLRLLWVPHYRNPLRPLPPGRVTLLSDVDHLEIAYWRDPQAGWQPEWAGVTLPKLIRIHIVFTGASGRHAPDVVVMPMRDRWRL
jgi:general secretion pathway protein J